MKSTGIIRRLDDVGRVVLPIELRRTLNMDEGVPLEIYTAGDSVVLRRYEPHCTFCGHGGVVFVHHGKQICRKCLGVIWRATTKQASHVHG